MKPTHSNISLSQDTVTAIILAPEPNDHIQKTIDNMSPHARVVIGCYDLPGRITGGDIIRLSMNKDRSVLWNNLLEKINGGWILILEQGEEIIGWKFEPKDNGSYTLPVLRDGVITKEIRLWHASKGLRFRNPIFETVYDPAATYLDIPILSKSGTYPSLEAVKEWQKSNPSSPDPYYYRACVLLSHAKYQEFLNTADHYLFLEHEGMSAVMINYYSAMVRLYQFEDTSRSLKQVVQCLSCNPLMAEFWCLLADVYYKLKKYDKAKIFYENAILLGSRRHKSDPWPIEIAKYRKYPKKMIESCNEIIRETKTVVGANYLPGEAQPDHF
jgi:tetratricopeptide (TPR) repeat protein